MSDNSGVISSLPFPVILPTPFVRTTQDSALFSNFITNHAELREEHKAFIRGTFVRFLIQQLEANGFNDTRLTILTNGSASATGAADENMALSLARAESLGAGIKAEFDIQKTRSPVAKSVNIVVKTSGVGDTLSKGLLAVHQRLNPGRPLTPPQIELLQPGARSAFAALRVVHVLTGDEKITFCRQNFAAKFKKKKVPANQLEQVLDDAERRLGGFATFLLSLGFGKVKALILKEIKEGIAALADIPLLGLVFAEIEFVVPSDINLVFEFKDSKGANAFYTFSGSQQSKSVSVLSAVAEIVGVLKSLAALKDKLEKFDGLPAQFDQLKKLIANLAKATELLEKLIRDLEDPGGVVRKTMGNAFADTLLAILRAGNDGALTIPASRFAPIAFVNTTALFDIHTFNSPARTFTTEFAGRATTELSFLGTGPDGGRVFNAACVLNSEFSINFGMLGVGVANGFLGLV